MLRLALFKLLAAAGLLFANGGPAAPSMQLVPETGIIRPLQELEIVNAPGATVVVLDGEGKEYFRGPRAPELKFLVGGALGTQHVRALDAHGHELQDLRFKVDVKSALDDGGGRFSQLFEICKRTIGGTDGQQVGAITWRHRTYHYFDPWILDHSHTTKGMQYFSPWASDMVDLFGAAQKANGMIWSFAFPDHAPEHQYHYWAYKDQGYAWADDNVLFARQPVENHNEANFVDALYFSWKANGKDDWMRSHLAEAQRALDYSVTDTARWSAKYQLLKRGYTIDSWDFQPDDKYLVHFPMGSAQQIDPKRTKFVIFFGDNTAYAHACDQLAEMLDYAGDHSAASKYKGRALEIRNRINALAWNGSFYTHHIEEDPAVERNLGADEAKQLAMSNAYSLNRGVTQQQVAAIIGAYEHLRENLPPGSPGEWYAVYPPYTRGFDAEDGKWQYMNGGVQAHAAGELARGALEHGFENYGADILSRLSALGAAHGGKLYFAYTGAFPPPPPNPAYHTIDIASQANMAITGTSADALPWMENNGPNDMRNLPLGSNTFAGIPFDVPKTAGRAAVAVSAIDKRFPLSVDVPVHGKSAAVYLLHAADKVGPSKIAGSVTFRYSDGSSSTHYLFRDKQVASTWFPKLDSPDAGVAWRGANGICGDVGVSWAAIKNPASDKVIDSLSFSAPGDGSIYAVLGVTLADRMPWHQADAISYGGPDNWSSGLVLYALVHGLAGVDDRSTMFRDVELSPRWTAADVDSVTMTARYGASNGYLAYRYRHDRTAATIDVFATGNATHCTLRILLPAEESSPREFDIDGQKVPFHVEKIEHSTYAVAKCSPVKPVHAVVHYR